MVLKANPINRDDWLADVMASNEAVREQRQGVGNIDQYMRLVSGGKTAAGTLSSLGNSVAPGSPFNPSVGHQAPELTPFQFDQARPEWQQFQFTQARPDLQQFMSQLSRPQHQELDIQGLLGAPVDVTQDPSYQFRLQQGQRALEASAAQRGLLHSGGTLSALERFAQDYASTEYQNAWQRQQAQGLAQIQAMQQQQQMEESSYLQQLGLEQQGYFQHAGLEQQRWLEEMGLAQQAHLQGQSAEQQRYLQELGLAQQAHFQGQGLAQDRYFQQYGLEQQYQLQQQQLFQQANQARAAHASAAAAASAASTRAQEEARMGAFQREFLPQQLGANLGMQAMQLMMSPGVGMPGVPGLGGFAGAAMPAGAATLTPPGSQLPAVMGGQMGAMGAATGAGTAAAGQAWGGVLSGIGQIGADKGWW